MSGACESTFEQHIVFAQKSHFNLESTHVGSKRFDRDGRHRSHTWHGLESAGSVRLAGQRPQFRGALRDPRCFLCNLRQHVLTLFPDQRGQVGGLIFHKHRHAIKVAHSYRKHVAMFV